MGNADDHPSTLGTTSLVGVILYLRNCLLPVRFAVRSLGWTEIAEEDLTAEKSSRAVNKAIVDLSTGRNDIIDNVSKWGDGRELIMELDDNDLTLIDPDTMAVVHSERIQQIRVWGVGRDNGRFVLVSGRELIMELDDNDLTLIDPDTMAVVHSERIQQIRPVRFAVRSLGWTEIAEEDLTAEKSSRAVNKAIVDLSTGRNDIIDNVSKWGDGRELIMELDDNDLTLIDPDTMAVVHSERIQQIRVWGVGRDNGRDFAYVARDRNSRRYMCHVFRCDTPARTIANTLRDICKRLMLQRRPNTLSSMERNERRVVARDSSLPTPIEEPKKTIRCHFLGVTQVPRATGIEILNEAVDRLVPQVRPERWILADVSIAPSTITINEVNGNQIAECRVRYLSFLGIGRDIKHCAFIMHTSSENFMCYVFHVEPNAGAMAKTIEAACKLRYQKVLDAHTSARTPPNGKGWGDSLWSAFGSMRERFSSSYR
ncbi:Amyloid beta A4 precursor protein-binding family B member 2 [Toxocara canis]|uniref:Amyloid beta A4 protein-binding family B member 2 n=2 Tax=Toxocara canis TaxID=6265 RepID=A0A0B2W0L9_TOXCA|nr:Amyloid beta A4 precursor protein-binding family B member 2 [Toxocara canis]